ncbi:MAG: hypothetical protein V4819_24110 [Verrucomicrobiota bacterium]
MEPPSLFGETILYFFWGGFVQFCLSVLVAPFLYLITLRISKKSFHTLFRAYAVFNVCLLLWGCLGSYILMATAYGKLYTSVDRLVDWYAFLPFGQWVLDDGFGGEWHGHLIGGASLWQLRLLWLAVALPIWLLALASTRLALRFLPSLPAHGHSEIKEPNKAWRANRS